MIKLNRKDGTIEITSPYNALFVKKVKGIGGKWGGTAWIVSEDVEEQLMAILENVYGYAPEDKKITVKFAAKDFESRDTDDIRIGDMVLVERRNRDWDVNFHNAIVLEGGFPSSGGSAKHPYTEAYDGTILQSAIPKAVYERLPDEEKAKLTIIERKPDKKKLLEEKEKLLARLAEIEELLK